MYGGESTIIISQQEKVRAIKVGKFIKPLDMRVVKDKFFLYIFSTVLLFPKCNLDV